MMKNKYDTLKQRLEAQRIYSNAFLQDFVVILERIDERISDCFRF